MSICVKVNMASSVMRTVALLNNKHHLRGEEDGHPSGTNRGGAASVENV